MKKIIALALLLFIGCLSMAQVILQPLLPQVGVFQKSQLWNLLAVNSSQSAFQCYLVLSLQDRQTGSEVMAATSSGFTLEKGSKQLNETGIAPVQYTYFSFSGDRTDDFLTAGSYVACFKLMSMGHAASEVSEVCVPFDVAPLSPPMLVLPADSSLLQVQPAQFTWQPPAPLTMFRDLHYELLIAEILPGQQPEEAVELNAPFYTDLNVPLNFMNYTGAYPSFEKNKWYAWQVVAQDGENYAAKTPVYDFMIGENAVQPQVPVEQPYVTLKRNFEAGAVICKGSLRVAYDNAINDKTITYEIIALADAANKTVQAATLTVKPGKNFIDIPLDHQYRNGTTYLFRLMNSRAESWNVKFVNTK